MGYDLGDSFPFDSEPNGIPFGSKSKGKLSPRSYPIRCERKMKYSFLSVRYHYYVRIIDNSLDICMMYRKISSVRMKRIFCEIGKKTTIETTVANFSSHA